MVAILAIDFAANAIGMVSPAVAALACLWDGVLILGVFGSLMSAQRSILDLWSVAIIVGELALVVVMAVTPAVVQH